MWTSLYGVLEGDRGNKIKKWQMDSGQKNRLGQPKIMHLALEALEEILDLLSLTVSCL